MSFEPRGQFSSPVAALPYYPFHGMMDVWAAYHGAAVSILGATLASNAAWTRNWSQHVARFNRLANVPAAIERAYRSAGAAEAIQRHRLIPLAEPMLDFSAIEQRHPGIKITSEIPSQYPSIRIHSFDRLDQSPDDPTIVVNAADSGKTGAVGFGSVLSYADWAHRVLLIEHRDPRFVEREYAITLGSSANAVAFVARQNPGCILDGTSQGELVATLAAAKSPDAVAGLVVAGSPIHPKSGNSVTSTMSRCRSGSPRYVETEGNYPGSGRFKLPGDVMDVFYRAIGESCAHSHPQDLPAELIDSVLAWYDLRDARFDGIADLSKITCPIVIVTAKQDLIVDPLETLALKKLTPDAAHAEISIPGGHYDLLDESVRRTFFLPAIGQMVAQRATGQNLFALAR